MSTDKTKPNAETPRRKLDLVGGKHDEGIYFDPDEFVPKVETPKPETQAGARNEAGDYSCAVCGFGMKKPCTHWQQLAMTHSQTGAMEAEATFQTFWADDTQNHSGYGCWVAGWNARTARDARREADAQKIGETVALREAALNTCVRCRETKFWTPVNAAGIHNHIAGHQDSELCKSLHIYAMISSDGQSLFAKHDAEILAVAAKEAAKHRFISHSALQDGCSCSPFNGTFNYIRWHHSESKERWAEHVQAAILALIPAQPSNAKPAGGK
jgi:hypothetical protein